MTYRRSIYTRSPSKRPDMLATTAHADQLTTLILRCSRNSTGNLDWSVTFASEQRVRILCIRFDGFLILEGTLPGRWYLMNSRNGVYQRVRERTSSIK